MKQTVTLTYYIHKVDENKLKAILANEDDREVMFSWGTQNEAERSDDQWDGIDAEDCEITFTPFGSKRLVKVVVKYDCTEELENVKKSLMWVTGMNLDDCGRGVSTYHKDGKNAHGEPDDWGIVTDYPDLTRVWDAIENLGTLEHICEDGNEDTKAGADADCCSACDSFLAKQALEAYIKAVQD